MRKFFALVFVASAFVAAAQPKKAPKMEPVTSPGYYVNPKGDTIKGEIRTNPEDETEFYREFFFKPAKGGRLMPINIRRASYYGFDGRHFVASEQKEGAIYLERLAQGRLNLFKHRFHGKIDGIPAIEIEYYAQDTRAEEANANLKEINKISTKFYKKDLKPYLKDQPMIWSDLDKFNFNEQQVVNAFNEFNNYYITTAN